MGNIKFWLANGRFIATVCHKHGYNTPLYSAIGARSNYLLLISLLWPSNIQQKRATNIEKAFASNIETKTSSNYPKM